MNEDRILAPELLSKVMTAEQAAGFIKTGMTLGYSGFSVGFPKAIPLAVYDKGEARELTVICGAAIYTEPFSRAATSGAVSRFTAFQFNREMRGAINAGNMEFMDVHLSQLADKLRRGVFGKIDYAIVECAGINADGSLVPTLSAGVTNALVECAEHVLVEINTYIPLEIRGLHDFGAGTDKPLASLMERLGGDCVPCETEKITGIVFTHGPDKEHPFRDALELHMRIADSVVACLKKEIAEKRLPPDFTLQVGTGGVANAVMKGLEKGGFSGLRMYTEVFTDSALDFIKSGVLTEAATTCLDLSSAAAERFLSDYDFYKKHIVIRPLEVTNNPKRIAEMGLVAMNTAVEADIYGNVNSSHAAGVSMINGVGGSNDFSRASRLSIFITPSTAKDGAISAIVPMVSHVDSTEHDTDIIATEYGYADLRGLSPKERVPVIIENCAHPDYRPQLRKYFEDAVDLCGPCQTPHDLSKALSWHQRFTETGTMREE